jgi:hypothetical protein
MHFVLYYACGQQVHATGRHDNLGSRISSSTQDASRALQQLQLRSPSSGKPLHSPLPPPQQPDVVTLRHKPSLLSQAQPVNFYKYKGNSSYSKELLPVLFLLSGGNVEAIHYSQVSIHNL